MDRARWDTIKQLFDEVADLEADARARLLTERCGDDDALRREVEDLLKHDGESGSLLTGTPAKDDDEDTELTVGASVNHYRLQRLLSRGGMGEVHLAVDTRLDRQVALKLIHGKLISSPQAAARFAREARAAAKLRSRHAVHVYDHGVDSQSGRQYIAMEYLEGEDLEQRLRRVGRLSPKETMRICNEICRGLGRAHRMGIVHRDLKPANVFLSGDDEMVKLLDFGIAKVVGPRARDLTKATATGDVLGSPHYMSPEQARGQSVDGRSDLWSLAVIAYRLLTGKRPFDGDVPGDVIVRICTEPVVPPSQHLPSLNEGVDRFFERALAQDPDARFQSAEAFATELRAALVAAEPPRPASLEATHASASGASRRLALAGAAAAAVMALMGLQWGRYSTTSMPRLDSQASATLERVAADALRTSRGAVPSPTVVGGADPDGSPTAERPPDASSERAPPSAPLPKQARGVDMRDDVALGY